MAGVRAVICSRCCLLATLTPDLAELAELQHEALSSTDADEPWIAWYERCAILSLAAYDALEARIRQELPEDSRPAAP